MEAVFLKILNMSITASWIVLAIALFRLIFKKAPKAFTCLLWGLVAVRLICPLSMESVLSLIPSAEPVPQEMAYTQMPTIPTGAIVVDGESGQVITESVSETMANPMPSIPFIASIVWLAGVAAMLIYAAISYLRVRSKVKVAMPTEDNTWICDHISTPFILGIVRPRIYLPSFMGAERDYIIAHEKAHLRRKDHWWKPLGFVLLSVYWFNPILWIAYILLCRDIELACDEKVIKGMDDADKKAYTSALLNSSISHRWVAASPLAFGEVGVKSRIKSVLNYKKPPFWIMLAAVVAAIAVAIAFLTDPIESAETGGEEVRQNSSMTAQVSSQEEKEPETSSETAVSSEEERTVSKEQSVSEYDPIPEVIHTLEICEMDDEGNYVALEDMVGDRPDQLFLAINSEIGRPVTWSSSDEMKLMVDENGVLGGSLLNGSAKCDIGYRNVDITATLPTGDAVTVSFGGGSMEMSWGITDEGPNAPEGIKYFQLSLTDNEKYNFKHGSSNMTVPLSDRWFQIECSALFSMMLDIELPPSDGTFLSGNIDDEGNYWEFDTSTDPSDLSITWASSDPSVATVDKNGLVTLHKRGRTLITATIKDELRGKRYSDTKWMDYIYVNIEP